METAAASARPQRLIWLDTLKALGIFAVMFGHICTVQQVLDWLYTFHVPLFFIAGGILYRSRDILCDIRRRAFRILLPYLFFGVIIVLYYSFIERQWRDVDMNIADCFVGLLIGDMQHLGFHSHLWFLPCYFLTTVVYNVLYRLIKPAACRAVCAAACLAYVLLPIPSLPWGADRMLGFLGLFALGELSVSLDFIQKIQKLNIPAKLGCSAVLIALSVTLSLLHLTSGVMWIVCAVIGTAGFAALAMAIEKLPLLPSAGQMTLVILCIHGPIYRILIKLASMASGFPSDQIRASIPASLLIAAATLAICCGIYIILKKLLPWSIGLTPQKSKEPAHTDA